MCSHTLKNRVWHSFVLLQTTNDTDFLQTHFSKDSTRNICISHFRMLCFVSFFLKRTLQTYHSSLVLSYCNGVLSVACRTVSRPLKSIHVRFSNMSQFHQLKCAYFLSLSRKPEQNVWKIFKIKGNFSDVLFVLANYSWHLT